ncbi:MAG: FKBP-type peptidyl-prolyl cis-trans isomerase [Sodaliphilus sp.]
MKKIWFAIVAMATLCQGYASAATEAEFKAQQDSLSKAYGKYFGMAVAYMSQQKAGMSVDEFFKGLDVVMQADTANQAYMNGLAVGMELVTKMYQNRAQKGVTLNKEVMLQALKEAAASKGLEQSAVSKAYSDMMVMEQDVEVMSRAFNPKTIAMKKDGEEYIAKILASGEGYVKTPSGLVYKIIREGNGKHFGDNEDVRMLYVGKHVDGAVFDQSRDTTSLNTGQVVKGFQEAVMLMSPGAKMVAVLPADIAYGDRGAGRRQNGEFSIYPGETLIFEIETFESPAPAEKATEKAAAEAAKPAAAQPKSTVKAKNGNPGKKGPGKKGKK